MKRVRVKILGALARPKGTAEFELALDEEARLEDALLAAGYHRAHLRLILASVNGAQQGLGYRLQDGDELLLAVPASGG